MNIPVFAALIYFIWSVIRINVFINTVYFLRSSEITIVLCVQVGEPFVIAIK